MAAVVISLFDFTGVMLEPWLEAGYECHLVDKQHPSGRTVRDDGMHLHSFDLTQPLPLFLAARSLAFVSAFPPCDSLAVSGARWFKGKGLRALEKSIAMFATAAEFCEDSGAPYIIENPISTISTYWRKPDHIFHPYEYARYCQDDNYTKKTCLWTGGGLVMPQRFPDDSLGEPDDRIHKMAPSPERANMRSATPLGFARAVFAANHQE